MAKKETYNSKKTSIGFIVFLIVITIIGFFIGFVNSSGANKSKTADGFTIESYNVDLVVKEDNKVDVTETIKVYFYNGGHHGIYKTTPEWLQYTGVDNKTIKRKSLIYDMEALNDNYTISRGKDKKIKIKIGNANTTLPIGNKEYVIKYTYDMGSDPYTNFDEFIFHAYGDYWGTEIKNASISLTMPKDIDKNMIKFFTDKYRKEEVTDYVDYEVNGNKLQAYFNSEKYKSETHNILDKALTIDLELPEGYFVEGSNNYGLVSLLIFIGIFIYTIINVINWTIYGKDLPESLEIVEYYPPENYDPSELGYIYGQSDSSKLVVSTIVNLAAKGYIRIDEEGKEIKITDLYSNIPKFDYEMPPRIVELEKLKDADDTLSDDAKKYFNDKFKESDKVILEDDNEYDNFSELLLKSKFIKVLNDNDKARKSFYDKKKKEYDDEVESLNNKNKVLKPLSENEKIVYDELFSIGKEIILSEHDTLYTVFSRIPSNLYSKLEYLIMDKKSHRKSVSSFLFCAMFLILWFISYYVIEDLNPKFSSLYWFSLLCIPFDAFLAFIMNKKTQYGEDIVAKVNGFKEFLEKVEKDKLEKLVEENPNYFYDILPYTYVFNISKKWIDKFKDIPLPETNMGNFDYTDIGSLSDVYSNISFPSSSDSGSGGCSSCGGGGGCSSCGGGGSW